MLACVCHKLKTACKAFTLAAVFFFIGYSYPAEAKYSCGAVSDIFREMIYSGYAYFSTAENGSSGISLSLFIDQYNHWKLVGVDKDLNACVIMSGYNWQFIIASKA